MKQKGFSLVRILIFGFGIAVVIAVFVMLLLGERARTRDAQRIGDMTRLAAGFALLYNQKASFLDAAAGCPTIGSLAGSCTLESIIPNVKTIEDPGSFGYLIRKVPDRDDFAVQFRLERKYGTWAAGYHVLTKSGIQ